MVILIKRKELSINLLLEYLLFLGILMNFLSFPSFGMMALEERNVRSSISKNYNVNNLNSRNYDKMEIESEVDKNKKYKAKKNCYCENLYYYISLLFVTPFQKKQARMDVKPESLLEVLPDEIIIGITKYLDPLSIVKLSHVNGRFRNVLNDKFWVQYNSKQNYQSLNEERSNFLFWFSVKAVPAMKVMVANYYYQVGKNLYWERKKSDAEVIFRKVVSLGLKIPYRECVLCETKIPYNNDSFCPDCAPHAWDKCRIAEVQKERENARREERIIEMMHSNVTYGGRYRPPYEDDDYY